MLIEPLISDGVFYMPEFDVYLQASPPSETATLAFSECDQSEQQQWLLSENVTISPASIPEMCIRVGAETCTSKSAENQMRPLWLEACKDEPSAKQVCSHQSTE